MSWISDNYEKAALGGSLVVAIALGAVIFKNMSSVEESFNRDSVQRNDDVSVPGLDPINQVKDSLTTVQIFKQPEENGRKVDLMTGVPLFAKRGDVENPVDLGLDIVVVHSPIPNSWWLENGIDPGYSDSPDRDPDEDGFSNREEFVAQTDPNEFKSHPDPVTKLQLQSVKTTQYFLKPSDYGGGKVKFKLLNTRGTQRNKMDNPVVKGGVIMFKDALMKDRFKFKDLEEMDVKKSGITQKIKIWVVEDLKPNKVGTEYRFNKSGKRVGDGPSGIIDSTAELALQALREGGNPFKVEENTRFALPFKADATEKPYLLKKIDVQAKTVEIEYLDGKGNKTPLILHFPK